MNAKVIKSSKRAFKNGTINRNIGSLVNSKNTAIADQESAKNSILKNLKSRFYKKNKLNFALCIMISLLTSVINISIAWIIQQLIDIISGSNQLFSLQGIAFVIAGLLTVFVLTLVAKCHVFPLFMRKSMKQYKDYAFGEITKKDISSFKKENSSLYLSALTNDAIMIESEYIEKIPDIIVHVVTFVLAISLMLYYSPLLTAIAIIATIIPLAASILTGSKAAPLQTKVSDSNNNFTASISDFLTGFFVVKSFKAEKEVNNLFVKSNEKLEDNKYKMKKLSHTIGAIGATCGIVAQLSVFFAGAVMAVSGKAVTPGIVMAFVQLMNYMIAPVANIPPFLAKKKAADALMEKLSEELSKNREYEEKINIENINEGIRLENVSFGYSDEKEILHDISLDFKKGKSYAIVGASGSGKSTLLNLLLSSGNGQTSGNIYIDNQNINTISSESLYDEVSVIGQNVFLFNSTIKNNITMFKDFDENRIMEVVNKAHLSKFMEEHGKDFDCGENGKNLSGGEKQRISIARSLLRNSSVLLADEVTAALDPKTAFEVSNEILDLEGITRIVVTHSLEESLMKRYDEIIVLRDGRVEEIGSFEDLINNQGYFNALYTVSNAA